MQPRSWAFLHDGHIFKIEKSSDLNLTLHVSVLYLREMFPGEGVGFKIEIIGCKRIEYTPYDREPLVDLQGIVNEEPELLSVESENPLSIVCSGGTLVLEFAAAEIFLDTGEPISDEQLSTGAAMYWENWKKRNAARS